VADPDIGRIENGIAGLVGGLITLTLCALIGLLLRKHSRGA
jgi:hypothetical protein